MQKPLLNIEDLTVSFSGKPIVKGISLDVLPGETLGVIGESGSGKSVTAFTIAHLLPFNAEYAAKKFEFDGVSLLGATASQIDPLRGNGWAVIFQDPTGSFNPVKTIQWHMDHVMRRAARSKKPGASLDATALLKAVGIKTPDRVLKSVPSQLSGGMLQRVLIAMVTALRPKLIIADEPTTNLDKVIENQILDLLEESKASVGASVILITHDLLVAQHTCDRLAVMYQGELVEKGATDDILNNPQHPYTRALLESSRSLARGDEKLKEISAELKALLAAEVG